MIVLYRPPTSDFRPFLDDVGKALLIAAVHHTETVRGGDFKTRYVDPTCTEAKNLTDLLETSCFVQHARGVTHERGNTLNLVITSETSHLIVTAITPMMLITDHYAIECDLHQTNLIRLKRHVGYRKYAAIDNNRFAADLAASDVHAPELDPAVFLTSMLLS